MKSIVILYDHEGGQTEKIARFISGRIKDSGLGTELAVVGDLPIEVSLEQFDGLIIGGSVRGSIHSRALVKFIKSQKSVLRSLPCFFYSVSLSAAGKSDRQQENAKRCAEQFLGKTGWQPQRMATFAGALRYREYNPILRWLMKRLVRKEGGDTDTSQNYEYPDWGQVAEFADLCLEDLKNGP